LVSTVIEGAYAASSVAARADTAILRSLIDGRDNEVTWAPLEFGLITPAYRITHLP
jgi:hypothetical protein